MCLLNTVNRVLYWVQLFEHGGASVWVGGWLRGHEVVVLEKRVQILNHYGNIW